MQEIQKQDQNPVLTLPVVPKILEHEKVNLKSQCLCISVSKLKSSVFLVVKYAS